jgi:hypothetical protein
MGHRVSKPKASAGLDQVNPLQPGTPAPECSLIDVPSMVRVLNQVLRVVQVEAKAHA